MAREFIQEEKYEYDDDYNSRMLETKRDVPLDEKAPFLSYYSHQRQIKYNRQHRLLNDSVFDKQLMRNTRNELFQILKSTFGIGVNKDINDAMAVLNKLTDSEDIHQQRKKIKSLIYMMKMDCIKQIGYWSGSAQFIIKTLNGGGRE